MVYKIFISCLIFLISFCREDSKISTTFSNQDSSLPTMQNIKNIIIEPKTKAVLLESARKLGYSSIVDWYGNVLQRISEDELDFYYKIHKPKDTQFDVELISRVRREIHERIAWKKIFIESKIDFSKITPLEVVLPKSALENSQFLGSKNPKVQITEFSDFACYYCAKSQDIKRKLLAKYGKEIQWSFKNFPIISRGEESFLAHIALGCVEKVEPKKYWDYYFKLFENFRSLEKEKLFDYIKQVGVSQENWKTCMNDQAVKEEIISKIERDVEEGRQVGVSGTPSFVVNGKLYVGNLPFSVLESVIRRELEK